MKNVIITGANGFIGGALTRKLLQEGTRVWAVGRNFGTLERLADNGLTLVAADYERYQDIPALLGRKGFDAFFHFAWAGYGAQTHDFRVQSSNIPAAGAAAEAAARAGCTRFIYAGSCYEYLRNYYHNDMSAQPGPCSVYGVAKHSAGELCRVICHNLGTEFVHLQFSNVFGPGDSSWRTPNRFIRQMQQGRELELTMGLSLYDWTFIDDVIDGICRAAKNGTDGGVYYTGGNRLRPLRDIITDVRDALGLNVRLHFGARPDTDFVDYSKIDIHRLYRDTGYMAGCDFTESVQKTARWVAGLPEG